MVRSNVCCGGTHLTIEDALLPKYSCLWFRAIISLVFFHMVRAGAYWHKKHDIHACAFTVQTKYVVGWPLRNQKSSRGQVQGLSWVRFDPFCFCLFWWNISWYFKAVGRIRQSKNTTSFLYTIPNSTEEQHQWIMLIWSTILENRSFHLQLSILVSKIPLL